MSVVDEVPPPSASATLPVGLGAMVAGKYRVERLLGAGGMGLVVLATHMELEQRVAIKMMREEALKDADARARFAREAKAAVRLKSEHVARVIDVGTTEEGAPFLVMEYLEGEDLATLLESRNGEGLPVDQAVAYLLQVCEAVAEAHGAGIVHRDLKPRNIFVTTGVSGEPLLKVLDFGISKLLPADDATADLGLTRTRDVMGSPSYMAPEQLRAARDADERSDIWSLGVILYEIITGCLPFEADSVTELSAMVLRDPPRPMRALCGGVPHALDDAVARCLEKDRKGRFPSVVELAQALEPHANGLASGSAQRIGSVARKSRRPPLPSVRPESSSGARASAPGGTSVSWSETDRARAKSSSVPPRAQSRSGLIVGATLAVIALAAGGYAITHRSTSTIAAPVLPEDRGAITPPVTPSASGSAAGTAPENSAASPAPSAPLPIASIPRRAPTAPAAPKTSAGVGAAPSATKPPDPPAEKPPNAHDFGGIPRK